MRCATALAASLVMLLAAGCGTPTAPPSTAPSTSPPSPAPSTVAPAACAPRLNGDEVRGVAPAGVELWALLFSPYPLPQDEDVKIVWRMTGSGDLTLRATSPSGHQVEPDWGPEPHGDSTWHRPGAEWGAGFSFPTAGCWIVHASRGADSASVSLLVSPTERGRR